MKDDGLGGRGKVMRMRDVVGGFELMDVEESCACFGLKNEIEGLFLSCSTIFDSSLED